MEERGSTKLPYLFTGKELDTETGLMYYGARYYDPRTSVWQSPDPILNGYMDGKPNKGVFDSLNLSLYTYTRQNPIKFIDPDGKVAGVPYKNADEAANAAMDIMEDRTLAKGPDSKEFISYVYQGEDGMFYHTKVEESEAKSRGEIPGKQIRKHQAEASKGKRKRKGLVHSHGMANNAPEGSEFFSDQDYYMTEKDANQDREGGSESVVGSWLLGSNSGRSKYTVKRDKKTGKLMGSHYIRKNGRIRLKPNKKGDGYFNFAGNVNYLFQEPKYGDSPKDWRKSENAPEKYKEK